MRNVKAFAALAVFLLMSPYNMFAACPSLATQGCCGGSTWKVYNFDLSCAATTSGVTTSTMWCGGAAHRVAYPTTSTQTIQYQYTIPETSTGWEIRLDYEFTNGGSTSNFNRADYTVTRNFTQVASGNIYYTDVAASCQVGSAYPLSLQQGDILVVTIQMRTANSGSYGEVQALTLFKVPA